MLYLIDSSAVLNDFGFEFLPEHKYVTTQLAIAEFKDLRSRHLMENALQQNLLSIEESSKESLQSVTEEVSKKGFNKLSKTDFSILALALDLKKQDKKFLLITDDYSIQNFAKILEISFESAMRGEIGKTIAFSLSCPSCGKTLPSGSKEQKCPVCGSSLNRKKR